METMNAFFDADSMRPVIRVMMAQEEIFWGSGVRDLLILIQSTGSVRLACTQMNMSYSKGWKLLNTLERHVGFKVVLRQQGGKGGGEARLTTDGKEMLERFESYEQDCRIAAEEIFKKHFSNKE